MQRIWINDGLAAAVIIVPTVVAILALVWVTMASPRHPQCHFDRNEPGPQGWWWEIYKCSDGTERRMLVASPRG